MKAGPIVATTAACAVMGLAGCGSLQKMELDREVDRLCAIDGGVHIYEVVRLPKEDFGQNGDLFPQYRGRLLTGGRFGPAFKVITADQVLVAGNPALQRINTRIVRKVDDKLLGEVVIYRRSGGDLPGPAAASRYSCPVGPDFGLERKVFTPGEN